MITYVTSSPFREDVDRPTFSNTNGFIDRIRQDLPEFPRCLYICAEPTRHDLNCRFAADIFMAFANAGIYFEHYQVLDDSTAADAANMVAQSNFIVLTGGHVPTQNAFLQKIGLRHLLQSFDGIVMGISAGAMNCAEVVYAQPEEPGESSPDFQRSLPGLGLVNVNILPHYQKIKDNMLDGFRLIEDLIFADSWDRSIIALPDHSYVYCDNGYEIICGESYRIRNGILEKLTDHGQTLPLEWLH